MNIEIKEEQNERVLTTGEKLRQAREIKGLSQRAVAERLCLMISTIREIEEDNVSPTLSPTFVRGYIRSYAKLLQIPETEVLLPLQEELPSISMTPLVNSAKVNKKRKRWDSWLLLFTGLVLFVVMSLSGLWWWQHHKQQQESLFSQVEDKVSNALHSSDSTASVKIAEAKIGESYPLSSTQVEDVIPITRAPSKAVEIPIVASTIQQTTSVPVSNRDNSEQANLNNAALSAASDPQSNVTQSSNNQVASPSSTLSTTGTPIVGTVESSNLATTPQAGSADNTYLPIANTGLHIRFNDDCWVEIQDASGKNLAHQLQKKDSTLDVNGSVPYKVKLGLPSAVQIYYEGQPVDLGRFTYSNQVARLTIPQS